MKFLVTGGAGFIGSNYLEYVVNKYPDDEFVCLDALTYAGKYSNLDLVINNQNFKFIKGNIVDEKFVDKLFKKENFDVVINFAAETSVDKSINNPSIFILTNVVGTRVLLDASRKYNVKRYHQISTDEVYGELPLNSKEKFNEDSALRPTSPYAVSKASADYLVNSYYKTYKLPITISRTSNNYGKYQHEEKLIPLVITKILNNEKVPVHGDGSNIRDWIYVKDNVIAIDEIVRNGVVGETYNVGGNCEKTNLEVIKTILKILNKSENLIEFVKDRQVNDLKYSLDSSKLEKQIKWNRSYNFETGIKETIEWYLTNRL